MDRVGPGWTGGHHTVPGHLRAARGFQAPRNGCFAILPRFAPHCACGGRGEYILMVTPSEFMLPASTDIPKYFATRS